jgi:hypothetical protein
MVAYHAQATEIEEPKKCTITNEKWRWFFLLKRGKIVTENRANESY